MALFRPDSGLILDHGMPTKIVRNRTRCRLGFERKMQGIKSQPAPCAECVRDSKPDLRANVDDDLRARDMPAQPCA